MSICADYLLLWHSITNHEKFLSKKTSALRKSAKVLTDGILYDGADRVEAVAIATTDQGHLTADSRLADAVVAVVEVAADVVGDGAEAGPRQTDRVTSLERRHIAAREL